MQCPLRIFQGQIQGVGKAGLLYGGSGKESAYQLIEVVGRIQFFAVSPGMLPPPTQSPGNLSKSLWGHFRSQPTTDLVANG